MAAVETRGATRLVPFAYGFRPFFLAAFVYAPVAVGAWLLIRSAGVLPLPSFPPQLWHGHEMIFGFIAAAIAGFLLTAVPSWTGTRGFGGRPLIVLTLVWLAGRLAFAFAQDLPAALVVTVELAFLPLLAAFIAPPLLRALNRNTFVLGVLALLVLADALFMRALTSGEVLPAMRALQGAFDLVLILITVIGGRIVPAFTGNALRNSGVNVKMRSWAWLEVTVVLAMIAMLVLDVSGQTRAAGLAAVIAALAHALRLSGWHGWRTLRQPIVWILHVAYAWLPIGLALKAVFLLTAQPWSAQWLHALTMGAAATMIVAVVTRAALGHTGRPLVVERTVAVAYVLLTLATLVRVFGPLAMRYEHSLWCSGALWILAFALLLVVYAPVLLRPRVDGKPG